MSFKGLGYLVWIIGGCYTATGAIISILLLLNWFFESWYVHCLALGEIFLEWKLKSLSLPKETNFDFIFDGPLSN